MKDILVLYYSHRGSVRALAERIACGIESVPGMQARLRTVPRISTVCEATSRSALPWPWAARSALATWRRL